MKILLVFLVILFGGCRSDSNVDEQFGLQRDYIEQQAQGDEKSYIHYLSLTGLREDNADFGLVLKNVKNYFDTCKTKRPIRAICIIRKNKEHHFDTGEPNYNQVYKDAIFELYFKLGYFDSSSPIEKFTFYENGKAKVISMSDLNILTNEK